MRRSLLENIGLAGLALILGFLVWIGATFEENPPTTQELSNPIPIEVVNRPQGWLVRNQSAQFVRVQVRGRADSLDQLSTNSFRAVADLAGLEEGLHQVPVKIELSDKSVTVVSQDPPAISLRLDREQQKEIPVQVRVNDTESVPLGYTSRAPEVEPEKVTVTGPASLVEQVVSASASIWLQGAKSNVEKSLPVRLLDAQGNDVEELRPDPAIVTVIVPIDQELGFREVTVRAVITGTPAAGYWMSNIMVQPSTLTIFGLPSTLKEIGGFLETMPIDIAEAQETISKKVSLDLPRGISVLSEEAQQGVQVVVQISAISGGQTVQRPLETRGLSLGLKAKISPTMVDVILSGPLPALQDLTAEEVQVVVDLFGLSVGTHKVAPQAVLMPEGLTVVNIVPEMIDVTIELGP